MLSVAALVFPAAASQAAKPAFNACVSEPSQSVGMYSFSTTEYSPTLIKRNIYASGGGIANDSYYYSHHYDVIAGLPVIEVSSYSLKDWSVDDHYSNRTLANVATDIAYFAPRDEAYACFSNESGTGYLFGDYDAGAMLSVIGQATGLYRGDRAGFDTVRYRGMTADFSWGRSAAAYRHIYENL